MKIPFERTIAGAYRFAFANILSIIGIGWFPFLLFVALVSGLVVLLIPMFSGLWIADANKFDVARLGAVMLPAGGALLLAILAWIVVAAMVNVGIMRKALGQHPAPVFFFFSLGSQVWRLIGSYLLVSLLAWGVATLIVLAITAVSLALQKFAPQAQVPVTVLLSIAAGIWAIYALVRVQFFIPAVVVAENHIGITRSWNLGGGNFWRIVGISLIVTLPAAMASSTITSSMLQIAMGSQPLVFTPNMSPDESKRVLMQLLDVFRSIGPYYAAVQLLYFIVVAGLQAGAIANAYSLVTGGKDIAPPKASA
jgi:hypothetical protein